MLFPEIEAFSEPVTFFSGSYVSEERTINKIRVAAVICTYHREEYVRRNLSILQTEIFSRPVLAAQALGGFDGDNVKTLSFEETDRLKIFPSKKLRRERRIYKRID